MLICIQYCIPGYTVLYVCIQTTDCKYFLLTFPVQTGCCFILKVAGRLDTSPIMSYRVQTYGQPSDVSIQIQKSCGTWRLAGGTPLGCECCGHNVTAILHWSECRFVCWQPRGISQDCDMWGRSEACTWEIQRIQCVWTAIQWQYSTERQLACFTFCNLVC